MHTFTLLFHQQTPSGIELQHDTVSSRAGSLIRKQRRILFNSHWSFSFLPNPLCCTTSFFAHLTLGLRDAVLLALLYSHAIMNVNIDVLRCDIQRLIYVVEVLVSTGCDLGVDIIVL